MDYKTLKSLAAAVREIEALDHKLEEFQNKLTGPAGLQFTPRRLGGTTATIVFDLEKDEVDAFRDLLVRTMFNRRERLVKELDENGITDDG